VSACDGFTRSEALRHGVASAGRGLPSIEPGMPTPAGTGLTRRSMLLRSAGLGLSVYGASKLGLGALQEGVAQAAQSEEHAAAECIASWVTDFTADLAKVTVPLLVIHGDSDGTVPLEVSGQRSHEAVSGSELHEVEQGPHGINVSHADEFNRVLLAFLAK